MIDQTVDLLNIADDTKFSPFDTREGEPGNGFYILEEGEIAFTRQGEGGDRVISKMNAATPEKGLNQP